MRNCSPFNFRYVEDISFLVKNEEALIIDFMKAFDLINPRLLFFIRGYSSLALLIDYFKDR